jgi:hypothetical protein
MYKFHRRLNKFTGEVVSVAMPWRINESRFLSMLSQISLLMRPHDLARA